MSVAKVLVAVLVKDSVNMITMITMEIILEITIMITTIGFAQLTHLLVNYVTF